MSPFSTFEPGISPAAFRYRCIGCGDLSDAVRRDFRCSKCGDLLEIAYPGRKSAQESPNSEQLKSTWKQRHLSSSPVDRSGVWRFREFLPTLENEELAITLCEGNTPLYELPQCARHTGVPRLFAKHQGMNPT